MPAGSITAPWSSCCRANSSAKLCSVWFGLAGSLADTETTRPCWFDSDSTAGGSNGVFFQFLGIVTVNASLLARAVGTLGTGLVVWTVGEVLVVAVSVPPPTDRVPVAIATATPTTATTTSAAPATSQPRVRRGGGGGGGGGTGRGAGGCRIGGAGSNARLASAASSRHDA